jgi:membrane protein involved in colicin uptake
VQQQLEVELKRVAEAKRAGEAAERHAADVRRQVQREAKRVAELASAAVLAAAASPGDEDDDPAYGEPAEAASAPQPSAPTVGQHAADKPASGQHAADKPASGQHAADKPAGGQHAAAEKPGKVTGSAKVTVPPSASRVGADAE